MLHWGNGDADIDLNLGGSFESVLGYPDDRGQLSSAMKVQNDGLYQTYSYLIKSGVSVTRWLEVLKTHAHPAGMLVSGEVSSVYYNTNETNISFFPSGVNYNDPDYESGSQFIDYRIEWELIDSAYDVGIDAPDSMYDAVHYVVNMGDDVGYLNQGHTYNTGDLTLWTPTIDDLVLSYGGGIIDVYSDLYQRARVNVDTVSTAMIAVMSALSDAGDEYIFLDFQNRSSMSVETDGSGGEPATDDTVGTIDDYDENYTFAAPTDAERPTMKSGYVELDGTHTLQTTFSSGTFSTDTSVFILYRSSDALRYVAFWEGISASRYVGVGYDGDASTTIAAGVGSSYAIYVDGVLINPTDRNDFYDETIDGQWHVLEIKTLDMSAWEGISFGDFASYEWEVDIAGVFIGSDMSDGHREIVRNFFALKHNITLS